ncbi:MAG: hypothetical protein JOZ99_11565, partial [Actinobacteria bacterium]|nr:hypothetical protein [Actinomycetota bacterium]
LVVLLASLAVTARRRSPAFPLAVAALVAVVTSVVGLSRLVGPAFVWIPQPTRAIGMVCWLAGGWCLFSALPERYRRRIGTSVLGTATAALVAVVASTTITAATWRPALSPRNRALVSLANGGVAEARRAHGPILVVSRAPVTEALGTTDGDVGVVGLALVRKGIDIVVDPGLANRFGAFRAHPERAREEFVVIAAGQPAPPGFHLVASIDLLGARRRAERNRLVAQLAEMAPHANLGQIGARIKQDPVYARLTAQLERIPNQPALALVARRLQ